MLKIKPFHNITIYKKHQYVCAAEKNAIFAD